MQKNKELINRNFEESNGKLFYFNSKNPKIHDIQKSFQEMEFTNQKKNNEEKIYENFGCYKLTDGTNRATAEIKRIKYLQNTVNPIIIYFTEVLNQQLFSEFKNNQKLKIEKHTIGDSETIIKLLNNGILTPNQASENLGFSQDKEKKERDKYFYNSQTTFEDNLNYNFEDPFEKEKEEKEEEEKDLSDIEKKLVGSFFRRSRREKKFQASYLRRSLIDKKKIQRKAMIELRKYFRNLKEIISKNFDGSFYPLKMLKDFSKKDIEINDDFEVNFERMLPLEKSVDILHDHLKKVYRFGIKETNRSLQKIIKRTLSESDLIRNLDNEIYFERAIGDETRKRIKKVVLDSLNDNETIDQTREKVFDLLEDMTNKRASVIARTEASSYWDTVALKNYKNLDVEFVDVIGCEEFEPDSDCGRQNVPISQVKSLRFHPNHIGAIAPSKEI